MFVAFNSFFRPVLREMTLPALCFLLSWEDPVIREYCLVPVSSAFETRVAVLRRLAFRHVQRVLPPGSCWLVQYRRPFLQVSSIWSYTRYRDNYAVGTKPPSLGQLLKDKRYIKKERERKESEREKEQYLQGLLLWESQLPRPVGD